MRAPLHRGILGSALVSVALAGLLVALGVVLVRPTLQTATLSSLLSADDLQMCVAEPSSWGWGADGLSIFAYDTDGVSAHPDAPPLEEALLEQALRTGSLAREESETRVVSVVPRAADGPCAVLRVRSRNVMTATRPWLLAVLGLSVTGGMLLAGAGTFWLVVLPLRTRVEALTAAARGVGTTGFSAPQANSDALGSIAEVLAASHDRVVETREGLETRNRALEDHLAGIAHDLRTPLSSMQLALETVAAESEGALQPEARRALADVVYLSALVENLHQATRLRHEVDVCSGRVDLGDMVRRLEGRFSIVGRHAGVAVAANAPDEPVRVACTPALAERAVANVIQNAIEHNEAGGHVAVTLRVCEDAARFELVVRDDGPGLADTTSASLDAATFLQDGARRRGPGLGMLITAEVARRANWTIRYETLLPQGLQVEICGALSVEP